VSAITRLIHYDELDQLLDLYKQLHPEDPDLTDNSSLAKVWDEIYHDPNLHYLVVEKDGVLVASCALAIIKNLTRNLRPYGIIEHVITQSSYRNQGYGTQLLHHAIAIAQEHNCYKVMLLSGSKKEETLRFYENAGFIRGVKTGFIISL